MTLRHEGCVGCGEVAASWPHGAHPQVLVQLCGPLTQLPATGSAKPSAMALHSCISTGATTCNLHGYGTTHPAPELIIRPALQPLRGYSMARAPAHGVHRCTRHLPLLVNHGSRSITSLNSSAQECLPYCKAPIAFVCASLQSSL
jgi:hypothetical protein